MCKFQFGHNGKPNKNAYSDIDLFLNKCIKYIQFYPNYDDYKYFLNIKNKDKYRKLIVKIHRNNKIIEYIIFTHLSENIEDLKLYSYIILNIKSAIIEDIDDKDEWGRTYLRYRLSGMTHNNIKNHFYYYYVKIKSLKVLRELKRNATDKDGKIHYKDLYQIRYKYVKKKYGFKKLDKYLEILKHNYKLIIKTIKESKNYKDVEAHIIRVDKYTDKLELK